LLDPIKQSLAAVDKKMEQIELDRTSSYAGLIEQVQNLARGQLTLQKETSSLVQALRAPQVRGRWGEIQLKRVVEMAGMLDYCDFTTQVSSSTDEGKLIPDMVVRLPGGKNIVVDSKCPLQAYLDALNANTPEEKVRLLKLHAAHVAGHILKLSQKAYWEQFQPAPEFVILFLPGETFFSAALEQDPSLIESGVQQRVILATPTTLIALLRAVSFGWQQERVTRNVQEICELGRQACDRARVVTEHLGTLGTHLSSAVKAYNSCAVSLESRLLVTLRKFKESGVSMDKEIPTPKVIDRQPALLENGAQVLPGFDEAAG
jgi:DNA recombination protein RmuC